MIKANTIAVREQILSKSLVDSVELYLIGPSHCCIRNLHTYRTIRETSFSPAATILPESWLLSPNPVLAGNVCLGIGFIADPYFSMSRIF
jgi:hypothetical protein